MRQPGLGKVDWIQADKKKKEIVSKKAERSEKSEKKGGKK